MKLKTYPIIISEKFPKYCENAGEATGFEKKIDILQKIHTIRKNYEHWAKRLAKVENGEGVLSIRKWSGTPYKTPQLKVRDFGKSDGAGAEKLDKRGEKFFVGGTEVKKEDLARFDGLTVEQFDQWFKHADWSEAYAIIHFTGKRYGKKD